MDSEVLHAELYDDEAALDSVDIEPVELFALVTAGALAMSTGINPPALVRAIEKLNRLLKVTGIEEQLRTPEALAAMTPEGFPTYSPEELGL